VGAARTPGSPQRTLVDPTASMMPINRPIRIVMRDGRTIRGRRLNEDTYSVQLMTDQEQLLSIAKADVREYEIGKTSQMPSYAGSLTLWWTASSTSRDLRQLARDVRAQGLTRESHIRDAAS
jgi:hypothetical protein